MIWLLLLGCCVFIVLVELLSDRVIYVFVVVFCRVSIVGQRILSLMQ